MNYLLLDPQRKTDFLFVILDLKQHLVPNEDFMRGFQNGIERTSPKTGWVIQDFAFVPADIPVKGASYRFTCKAIRADGFVKYRFGYVGGVEEKYQFHYSDTSIKESAVFTKFVASFAFHR